MYHREAELVLKKWVSANGEEKTYAEYRKWVQKQGERLGESIEDWDLLGFLFLDKADLFPWSDGDIKYMNQCIKKYGKHNIGGVMLQFVEKWESLQDYFSLPGDSYPTLAMLATLELPKYFLSPIKEG